MGETMRKKHLSMKIVMFSVAALLLLSAIAVAGGGANWKVTVNNDTNYKCRVLVYTEKMTHSEPMDWRTLASGQQTIYETGSLCPCCIEGKVYDPSTKTWKKTRKVNIGLGNEINDPYSCSAACWNSTWKLCRKAGKQRSSHRSPLFLQGIPSRFHRMGVKP